MDRLSLPQHLLLSPFQTHDLRHHNSEDFEPLLRNETAAAAITGKSGPSCSRKKPKPPIIITRDSSNVLRTHVIQVADGVDIMETVCNFSLARQRGLCIISGAGHVNNLTLKAPGAVMPLYGRFQVLSLSGSFLPPPAPPSVNALTIYVSGGQGQVLGGSVVGQLFASGPVTIMVASFTHASYERLPLAEEEEDIPPKRGNFRRMHLANVA